MAKRKAPTTPTPDEPLPPAETPAPVASPDTADQAGAVPILSLKGRKVWRDWFTDLAKQSRTSKAGLIDRLTAEHAERIGFRPPPER